MAVRLDDVQIQMLIAEGKPLPPDYRGRLVLKAKRGHKEQRLDLEGNSGNEFAVILRQSNDNQWDFSVILSYLVPQSNQEFRLRRYNGRHEHTNRIERQRFDGFHVHTATERYQALGADEDSYAEKTDRYSMLDGALKCLFQDCGFIVPPEKQLPLLDEGA